MIPISEKNKLQKLKSEDNPVIVAMKIKGVGMKENQIRSIAMNTTSLYTSSKKDMISINKIKPLKTTV